MRISLTTKFSVAFILLFAVLIAAILLAVRTTVVHEFTTQYDQTVTASVQAVERDLQALGRDIRNHLQQLKMDIRQNADLTVRLMNRKLYHRTVIDFAGRASTGMRLDVFDLHDSDGIMISSAHDRNAFGKDQSGLLHRLRAAGNQLVLAEITGAQRNRYCYAAVDSVLIQNETLFLLAAIEVNANLLENMLSDPEQILVLLVDDALLYSQGASQHLVNVAAVADSGGTIDVQYARGSLFLPAFTSGGARRAELLVLHPREGLLVLLAFLNQRIFFIAGIGMVLAVVLSVWLARSVSKPLRRLADSATGVAFDNLEADFSVKSADEVGVLGGALNDMMQRLKQSRLHLAVAEQKAAFAQIARQVNHDIKNGFIPIRNVMLHWQEVADEEPGQLAQVFSERKTTVLDSISYLENLAGNYSRLNPESIIEDLHVNQLLTQVAGQYSDASAASAVEITLQLSPHKLIVRADRIQLRRAFENIIQNAIDAIGGSGHLNISSAFEDGLVKICFIDDGVGMEKSVKSKLFTAHFTTKETGTGLGLVNVKRIIEDYNGGITIESTPAVGTTVEIRLRGKSND